MRDAYREMEAWDPMTSTSRLGHYARRCLIIWAAIKADCPDPAMWCLYPKHHMWLHCAEMCTTNPRQEWTYADESETGVAVKLAARCNVLKLPVPLMEHYRAGVHHPCVAVH